jgi:hypothetical protein
VWSEESGSMWYEESGSMWREERSGIQKPVTVWSGIGSCGGYLPTS